MFRVSLKRSVVALVQLAAVLFGALAATAAENGPEAFCIKSAEILDKIFDLLITLDLALFGIVGFFVSRGLSQNRRVWLIQIIALPLFAMSASFSLFCGYKGRLGLAVLLASSGCPFRVKQDWYVYQAILLVISGALMAAIVFFTLLGREEEDMS